MTKRRVALSTARGLARCVHEEPTAGAQAHARGRRIAGSPGLPKSGRYSVHMALGRASVPAHLRQYVVEQDFEQYTEIDHAVWRFVLLETYANLVHTAHPAYTTGLSATGIRVDRIPRIEEMNDKLSRFGWGAVCVDGFIPPRAFQSFQANRILPIAAEMRTFEHLAYTAAPDIIHEAAGHAPILSEPAYAAFIQEFGATAEKAFATPADRALYRAVHDLSELKEDRAALPEQIDAAEVRFRRALQDVSAVSESAKLARLYWWTAEYGLIGTPEDYRLYGAGLLSSLGESRSCHDESVRKIPLSAGCVELDYDITREQPQLFVAKSFEQLSEVLDVVSADLAFRAGGERAFRTAIESEEIATLSLDSGIEVVGHVRALDRVAFSPVLVRVAGGVALMENGIPIEGLRCPNEYAIPFGALRDGTPLSALTIDDIDRGTRSSRLEMELTSGLRFSGIVRGTHVSGGRVSILLFERFELTMPNGPIFRSQSLYPLALAGALPGVRAGAPQSYVGASSPSCARVPRPQWMNPRDRQMLSLYEEAVDAWRTSSGGALVAAFERISRKLDCEYPDDWLLRWNLLESLVKVREGASALAKKLTLELDALDIKYSHKEPISAGLASIRSMDHTD